MAGYNVEVFTNTSKADLVRKHDQAMDFLIRNLPDRSKAWLLFEAVRVSM